MISPLLVNLVKNSIFVLTLIIFCYTFLWIYANILMIKYGSLHLLGFGSLLQQTSFPKNIVWCDSHFDLSCIFLPPYYDSNNKKKTDIYTG